MTERKPRTPKASMSDDQNKSGSTDGILNKDIQINIGRQLSVLWEKDTKKPVPDEWVQMVQRLEQKEAAELLRRRQRPQTPATNKRDDEDRRS